MTYAGRYINMDRSTERRALLEERFAALGCSDRYTRFPAIDGGLVDMGGSSLNPGEYGCFMSHYQCIKESMDQDVHLHIVEDDVVFGPNTILLLDQTVEDSFRDAEMTFTDIFIAGNLATMVGLMGYYRLSGILEPTPGATGRWPKFINFFGLKEASFAGSASYVIRSDARAKMLNLMEAELAAGPSIPVDGFFQRIVQAGQISACCTVPFLTSVDLNGIVSTTIEGRSQHDRSALAFFMLRNYFFVDKNDAALAQLGAELKGYVRDANFIDPLLDAFRFIFSEDFVAF
jgi:GR25 family glycosyltransferase involved in LPS biosynthesis